jgi:uncharacterized Zn finger protein (UPF0148 family)
MTRSACRWSWRKRVDRIRSRVRGPRSRDRQNARLFRVSRVGWIPCPIQIRREARNNKKEEQEEERKISREKRASRQRATVASSKQENKSNPNESPSQALVGGEIGGLCASWWVCSTGENWTRAAWPATGRRKSPRASRITTRARVKRRGSGTARELPPSDSTGRSSPTTSPPCFAPSTASSGRCPTGSAPATPPTAAAPPPSDADPAGTSASGRRSRSA